jgi:DNA modification methylase
MSRIETIAEGITLHPGDCLDVLAAMADASVDSCVCDPPYHLTSIVKRFGAPDAAPAKSGKTGAYARASRGFMGKQWDGGDIAFRTEVWAHVLRVLKPGGHLLAFSGTRTYHRMVCAIEDAGFEIRDQIGYLYGSGFPKSHNISRTIGVCSCEAVSERVLRPVWTPDVPQAGRSGAERGEILLAGLQEHSAPTAGWSEFSGDVRPTKSGLEGRCNLPKAARELREREIRPLPAGIDNDGANGRLRDGASVDNGAMGSASANSDRVRSSHRPQAAEQRAGKLGVVAVQPEPQIGGAWDHCNRCGKPLVPDGFGTALKPAIEPICVARKPLAKGLTVAENVLTHGTGAINIDGCRVGTDESTERHSFEIKTSKGTVGGAFGNAERVIHRSDSPIPSGGSPLGRWPANIVHDGSDEVVGAFPETDGVVGALHDPNGSFGYHGGAQGAYRKGTPDTGSAARFFYTAKADSDDRLGSKHPTVKPLDLMQWLVRLVTPPGGTVLDPFAGTGTTGEAAFREGFRAVLIEREPEYQNDIRRRMSLVLGGPDERRRESIKASGKAEGAGPLFEGIA